MGGFGDLGDSLRRELDVVHCSGRGVVVLDREPRRSGVGEERHGLGHAAGIVRVAALAVDVERNRRRVRQARHMSDQLVASNALVELADRPGEAGARRGERLEAGRLEQPRRADVPRVRHHEQLLGRVQGPEAGTPLVRHG